MTAIPAPATPCGLLRVDRDGRILAANETFLGWVGLCADEVIGRLALSDLTAPGDPSAVTLTLRTRAGGTLPVRVSSLTLPGDGGRLLGLVEVAGPAGDAARWLDQIERLAEVGAWTCDPATGRIAGSDQMFRTLGLRPGAALPVQTLLDRIGEPAARGLLDRHLRNPQPRSFAIECTIIDAGGAARRLRLKAEPAPDGRSLEGVLCDITRSHNAQQQLWRQANRDELTGLANRHQFQDRLQAACAAGLPLALLLLELDDFGAVNQHFGARQADAVLQEVGGRLAALLPDTGLVARLTGDRFALLIEDPDPDAAATLLAARVAAVLTAPLATSGAAVRLRASVGMATRPADAPEGEALLSHAHQALAEVRRSDPGRAAFLRGPTLARARARRRAIAFVRDAVRAGRVAAWYQPKVRLSDERISGHEALARLITPEGQTCGPDDWADALDDPECGALLDTAMLDRVLDDIRHQGARLGRVAVNLSDHSLRRADFADRLLHRLDVAGVDPRRIEIEVVETVLVGQRTGQLIDGFARLRARGVHVTLDDFGTGFASFTHLRDLPIDRIKLDRSFLSDLGTNSRNALILRAAVALARALDLETVAEGVEAPGILPFLRDIGCDEAQGYHFGRPAPLSPA